MPESPKRIRILAKIIPLIAITIAIFIIGFRASHLVSFSEPLQLKSIGPEGEAVFSLWKFVHGQAVYSDLTAAPFSQSAFNWLFYAVYGSITKFATFLTEISDPWIPTVARLVSIAFVVLGIAALALLFRREDLRSRLEPGLFPAAFSFLVFSAPTSLHLGMGIRPDVGGVVLTILAFLSLPDTGGEGNWKLSPRKLSRVLLAALFFASAWSFKPLFVSGVTATCLYLLLARQIGTLAVIAGFQFAVYALVFVLRPEFYLQNCFIHGPDLNFEPSFRHAGKALVMWPILGLAVLTLLLTPRRCFRAGSATRLPAIFLLVSLVFNTAASFKEGASHHYFFESAVAGAWLFYARIRSTGAFAFPFPLKNSRIRVISTSTILSGFLVIFALFNSAGLYRDYRNTDPSTPFTGIQHRQATVLSRTLKSFEKPVLVRGSYWFNLPWITGNETAFVYSFCYHDLERSGVEFEAGGIGGMIRNRYFETIVYPREYPPATPSFGVDLQEAGYRREKEDEFFQYFVLELKQDSGSGHRPRDDQSRLQNDILKK